MRTHTNTMYYGIVMLVIVIAQEGESEREAVIPEHFPSTWELKENYNLITAYISCNSTPLDTPSEPLSGRWNKVDYVVLTGCYPPAPPDPPALAQSLAARGARPLNIKHLQLLDIPQDARLDAGYFEGLNSIVDLEVQAAGEGTSNQLDGNFLQMLPRLNSLTLQNETLQPLQNNIISSLNLNNGQSVGTWGECKDLSNLYLREWRVPKDVNHTGDWLSECKGLSYLKAERMELDSLRTVLTSAHALSTIELPNNSLTSQDLRTLMDNTHIDDTLGTLKVPYNNLTILSFLSHSWKILHTLDISHNMITDFSGTVMAIFASVKLRYSVHSLTIDYNPLRDVFCEGFWMNDPWYGGTGRTPPIRVNFMSLVGTNISRVCFSMWSLEHLNLSTNNIEDLQENKLLDDLELPTRNLSLATSGTVAMSWMTGCPPQGKSLATPMVEFWTLPLYHQPSSVVVDLRNNPLRVVHFNETNYNDLLYSGRPRSAKVTVHTDTLPLFDCDCKNAWLARALREDRVIFPAGAQCRGGGELHAVPPDSLECDLEPCEPCTCRRQWKSRTVIVHCDALGLHEIPSLPNIGELHLRGNHIDNIRAENLSITLTLLDIRDNNISRVDRAAADALFDVVGRRVWLAGNPLVCDCDNWPLLSTLQAHRIQVHDYGNVTCMDGRLLGDLSKEQLCIGPNAGLWVWLVAGVSALVGLLAITGALYTCYDQKLKVWLYTRGWCLSCVREEELDADREYDAFVSFAHSDYEFVESHLLPWLEDEPQGYKVCVHYRDWLPGEIIPTQITRSVASSRRTIIVLSANFVQSMWGMVEFRAAHVSALVEGRVRVLVVALEDTPPAEELPEELRLYLRSTTYLRWDDPWFWKKLRYALPHRAGPDKRIVLQEEHVRETMPPTNDCEMVQYEQ